jgi:chlorite dismutase
MQHFFQFIGGEQGAWRVQTQTTLKGASLAAVPRVAMLQGRGAAAPGATWQLEGFTSNLRYTTAAELQQLRSVQEGLQRPQATWAALIPIKKSAAWWAMAQDERRAIFEETSHHTQIGMAALPQIARQLHHARDLGGEFDFITWFEFVPEHQAIFDELLQKLRATEEWQYVERELDIRLCLA